MASLYLVLQLHFSLFILTLFKIKGKTSVSLCAMLLDFTAAAQWCNQSINLLRALNAKVLINSRICFYSSTCNVQLFGL